MAAAVLATAPTAQRGAALALAAGVLYGLSDAATKAFAVAAEHTLFAAVLTPWPPIIVGLCVAAFFAFQRALQLGAPTATIVLMTAGMNLMTATAGLTVFGESLGTHTGTAIAHALAMAGVIAASLHLVALQARLAERRDAEPGGRRSPSYAARRAHLVGNRILS